MEIDLLIRGGTVVDGSGDAAYAADIAVRGGSIVDIGEIGEVPDVPTVCAANRLVTPGFIDIHSHSDFTLLVDPRAVSSISQGVTLEVVGNCGHGCAPIADPVAARTNIYGCHPDTDVTWQTMAEYLDCMVAARPAVNVATLVANGNLRMAAVEDLSQSATPDELRRMTGLLEESLDAGAIGYSTGLEYGPELACSEDEIVALCRVTSAAGGLYATHTRNELGKPAEAIEEAIGACRAAGVPLQISHISSIARLISDGAAAIERGLALVESARRQGLDVEFDMHTRLFGTTNLSTALPNWALEGGRGQVMARLRSREVRQKMKQHQSILTALAQDQWERIVLVQSRALPEFSQKSLADIAGAMGVEPLDAAYELLLAEIDDMHGLMVVGYAYREGDIRPVFLHDRCMVGSDATALAPDGPLACQCFHGAYTWASWFFRHFVRETRLLTKEEAIRRMTSLPAARLGLRDRGVLRRGARADIAIFDECAFSERGTTFEPNQLAAGMDHVLVNGVAVWRNGALTGNRSGEVLRG